MSTANNNGNSVDHSLLHGIVSEAGVRWGSHAIIFA